MRNRFFDPSFGKALPCENNIQKINRTRFPNALRGLIVAFARKPRVLEELRSFRTPPTLQISLLTQPLQPDVEHLYYKRGGSDVGRGMGLCGWSEADQIVLRLHDVPTLLLCLRPALPHTSDLWSPTSSGSPRRAPHQEVLQLDGPQGGGNGLVPGSGVMQEGWLIDDDNRWIWRF